MTDKRKAASRKPANRNFHMLTVNEVDRLDIVGDGFTKFLSWIGKKDHGAFCLLKPHVDDFNAIRKQVLVRANEHRATTGKDGAR